MILMALSLCAATAQAEYRTYYNQDIEGSPKLVKAQVWRDFSGKETDFVQLTLNITYTSYDSCQEAIALMTPVRVKGGNAINDFELLMGSTYGGCLTSIFTEEKALTLPNFVKVGSTFRISGRSFLVYTNADSQTDIIEQR